MEERNPKLTAIDNRGKLGMRIKHESDNKRKITNCRYETTKKIPERDRKKCKDVKQVEIKTCSRK